MNKYFACLGALCIGSCISLSFTYPDTRIAFASFSLVYAILTIVILLQPEQKTLVVTMLDIESMMSFYSSIDDRRFGKAIKYLDLNSKSYLLKELEKRDQYQKCIILRDNIKKNHEAKTR